jgi:hypothetical protein
MAGPIHYFIYYRVDAGRVAAARAAVARLLERVEQRAGVTGRCLQRADDAFTWMEIYEPISDARAFETHLREALAHSGLEECLAPGEARHSERFIAGASA